MKLFSLLVLSVAIAGCNDSIRSRSTINQSSSNSVLKSSMTPVVGTVSNIYRTSDTQSFTTTGENINVVKSTGSTFIKSIILRVEGNLVYKLIESRKGASPVQRKVQLEYIDLNQELNELVKKKNAEVSGDSIRIDMQISPDEMSEPQLFNNQMMSFESNSEYEAVFSISKPFCEFRSVLTTTTSLYLDGAYQDSAVSEVWERATCGKQMTTDEIRSLNLASIEFCDETDKLNTCEFKNLENLKP